eukprot:scaffold7029_cov375-Pinguiococcus_pyrenoidosus.AAC.6
MAKEDDQSLPIEGMLQNMLDDVKNYGHVPNGGRTYYLSRSQPPLLIISVEAYVRETEDWAFLEQALPALLSEVQFWESTHAVSVEDAAQATSHRLFRYCSEDASPRPESYREDVATAGIADDADGVQGAGEDATEATGAALPRLV